MMRWRPDPTGNLTSDQQSLSTKSKNDSEPDTTTSSSAADVSMATNSLQLRARLEDGDVSHRSTSILMASSAADHLAFGRQQMDQSDDSMDDNVSHDNFTTGNNRNKRSAPSSHVRGVSEAEPPDTDTETTGTSAGAATSHLDDDDGGDHATEDDDARSQTHMPWKPQNVQSTCEFTHSILDYAQKRESGCKKAEYSAVTTDELGNRWRLIVYVNGNGRASNHHLSLFLQVADAEDLPFGWKKSVSYVLTLEHPAGGSLSYAKRNPDKTFKLCPKAIDWGWSQFITSDRIQQEGFVHADSLTVRAQVTVKSSSVEIDEEDAELYLKCAVEEGDANSVRLCLEQGASVNCQFKDDLYTPLHTACSSGTASGSMEVLQLLLEKGADGNACNKWHETPLLIAANNGHRLAVESLLQHGANPSLCSEAGWSALTFAAHKGYDDIVSLLLRAGAPVNCPVTEDLSTPLHKACAGSKSGHLASVKLLLDGGANVHALNKWRETPLLTAANHGQAGAVEALLATGADPCKCTDTGWSPLSIAAYKGHDDVVRILLEEGAPTEEDDPTLSALLQAATKGLPDTVELLLRHGADHTVTTKKGDTALSILVEQNLIDAAVEMVTEYNASIPRCSRDRKKVQRARLLINLRMKQLEREDKENPDSSEGEETDDEYIGDRVAQHEDDDDDNYSFNSSTNSKDGKKKKKGGGKVSAEEKARAAEEALLLELAQEDAQAKKVEAEASTKRAKKKKKREREKELKMKEERERQEQKEQEEKEREERDRIRKEREEKERKDRELKLQQEKEREVRELLEREKILVTKRKEREEREKREKEPRQFTRNRKTNDRGSISPVATRTNSDEKRNTRVPKGRKVVTDPTPNKKIVSPKSRNVKPVAPLASNRRWETAVPKPNKPLSPRRIPSSDNSLTVSVELAPSIPDSSSPPNSLQEPSLSSPDDVLAPLLAISPDSTSNISTTQQTNGSRPNKEPNPPPNSQMDERELVYGNLEHIVQPTLQVKSVDVEHPAVSLFRREKVAELLHRCIAALNGLIDEPTLRRIVYRWITRAAHSLQPCIDPFIPSWMNTDELVAFFQRQFIGETRRHHSTGNVSMSQIPSMESLKEAGASVALFCHNMAKQVFEYAKRIESQIPADWTDVSLGMSVTDAPSNGRGTTVSIAWGNRANVFLPSLTFATLRDRHIEGTESNRFLTSAFVARIWYDTTRVVTKETSMDFRLSPTTQSCLSTEAAVTAELFSDPFTTFGSNVFWGRYEVVDTLFGGQKPFGKEDNGSEKVIARLGCSISVLLPLDNVVATQYMQRIISILDEATIINVPVSFMVFVHAECLYEISSNGLSVNDLQFLDPRLGDMQSKRAYLRRVEQLAGGRHMYFDGDVVGSSKLSPSPSLIVLMQNDAGFMRFNVADTSMSRIIASMSVQMRDAQFQTHGMTLQSDFPAATKASRSGMYYADPQTSMSPQQQRIVRPDNNSSVPPFSPKTNGNDAISRGRRGRLFALEDDGDEEQLGDVDLLMSGMLNNLDVAGLFKNTTVGSDNIDIEAISLMGIGPPSHSHNPRNTGRFG